MIVENIEYGNQALVGNLEPADIFTNPHDGLTYLRILDHSTSGILAVCMETGERTIFNGGHFSGSPAHVIKSATVRIK